MGKPIGQAHRSGKSTGNGKRKTAKKPLETVDENGSAIGDDVILVTPPPKKSRVMKDKTNTVNEDSPHF